MTTSTTVVTLPPAGNYIVDPRGTTVGLATRHMFNTGKVAATFTVREGSFTITEPATDSSFHAVIDAASFTSDKAKRDEQVRGPKFLHTEAHPDITVSATSMDFEDGNWTAPASVTAHGVTAPAVITLEGVDSTGGGSFTVRATMRIDRYAHGITGGKGLAGRWMDLTVAAPATAGSC